MVLLGLACMCNNKICTLCRCACKIAHDLLRDSKIFEERFWAETYIGMHFSAVSVVILGCVHVLESELKHGDHIV